MSGTWGPVRDDPALTSSSRGRAQKASPTVAIVWHTSVVTNRAEGHPPRALHRPRANMIPPAGSMPELRRCP